jgi:hypothetical protein
VVALARELEVLQESCGIVNATSWFSRPRWPRAKTNPTDECHTGGAFEQMHAAARLPNLAMPSRVQPLAAFSCRPRRQKLQPSKVEDPHCGDCSAKGDKSDAMLMAPVAGARGARLRSAELRGAPWGPAQATRGRTGEIAPQACAHFACFDPRMRGWTQRVANAMFSTGQAIPTPAPEPRALSRRGNLESDRSPSLAVRGGWQPCERHEESQEHGPSRVKRMRFTMGRALALVRVPAAFVPF